MWCGWTDPVLADARPGPSTPTNELFLLSRSAFLNRRAITEDRHDEHENGRAGASRPGGVAVVVEVPLDGAEQAFDVRRHDLAGGGFVTT